MDNLVRRTFDDQLGLQTLTPISSVHTRVKKWKQIKNKDIKLFVGDVCEFDFLADAFQVSKSCSS